VEPEKSVSLGVFYLDLDSKCSKTKNKNHMEYIFLYDFDKIKATFSVVQIITQDKKEQRWSQVVKSTNQVGKRIPLKT